MPLHDADPIPDHEPAGVLLGDRNHERDAGRFERAADRRRLVVIALEPLLDVEVRAGLVGHIPQDVADVLERRDRTEAIISFKSPT